jgi:hypothetical protein
MGKLVPPQGQPGDVADDRLRVEIESLQREIGAQGDGSGENAAGMQTRVSTSVAR